MALNKLLLELEEIESSLLTTRSDVNLMLDLSSLRGAAREIDFSQVRDSQELEKVRRSVERLSVISGTLMQLESKHVKMLFESSDEATRILKQDDSSEEAPLSEALPSYHMRKHFLATLDDPYPAQDDKDALVAATNESSHNDRPLQHSQLTLWFINARRRSGWSDIMKKFARGDRSRMKLLMQSKMVTCNLSIRERPLPDALKHNLDDVLRDNMGGKFTAAEKKEFEDDWNSMISWIKYGVKEKVGSWVYDLVAANKKTSPKGGQQRAVNTAAKRTPARKTQNTKLRAAKPRASNTSSTSSDYTTGLESTPELSMCSTADTSFSSLSSTFSLPQYDPFQRQNELLQSPTLNAAAGRKVRALPKRAFKLQKEALYTADQATQSFTGTCGELVPGHTLITGGGSAQGNSCFPPFDALGQVPMPVMTRRESLTSNSLSAAFG
nr:homeodomain transcription factor bE [Pseudozyma thailandica]